MTLQDGYSVAPMGRMGERPGGVVDYAIVVVAVFVVIIATGQMVRWLVWPGETATDHIKRQILDDE